MKKAVKTSLFIAASAGCFFLAKDFCYSKTDGFTITGITPDRPFDPTFATRALSDRESTELNKALDQPYSYYGYGAQAYIFFSSDGNYALKLFKQRIYTTPFWFKLPIPILFNKYKQKLTSHRKDKQLRDFLSYKLAFEELQDLSGVVFVHLNPTSSLHKKLQITDKIGITHELALDQIDFVLQKRAEHVHTRIDRLMKEGQVDKAKESITALVDLILTRCRRGINDRDPSIDTNCGFLEDRAIKIDIGRMQLDPAFRSPTVALEQVVKITAPFNEWLKTRYPELAIHLEQEWEQLKNKSLPPLDQTP